jgi:hypothetical protein
MKIHFAMRLGLLAANLLLASLQTVRAQTPSPLQEWQYSGGIILARLFEPDLPRYRTILGLAAEVQPVYDGSRAYRVEGGPVINIHYLDIAFISTGEGVGYNLLRGDHYQLGIALTYDLGRKEKDDLSNLRGMGNIGAAPVGKIFGSWVLSKSFPMILRVDARQFAGGRARSSGGRGGLPTAAGKLAYLCHVCRSVHHSRYPSLSANLVRCDTRAIVAFRASGVRTPARRYECRRGWIQCKQILDPALDFEPRHGDRPDSGKRVA